MITTRLPRLRGRVLRPAALALACAALLAGCEDLQSVLEPEDTGPRYGSVSGTVVDPFGSGIEGVRVSADGGAGAGGSVTTDAAGRFAFSPLEEGSWVLTARKGGFRDATSGAVVLADLDVPVTMKMDPEALPSSGALATRVVSYAGSDMTFEVDLFVVDSEARPVSGLGAGSFRVQNSSNISFSGLGATSRAGSSLGPYSATLLLDQSGSIVTNDPNDSRIQAAKIFLDALGAGDNAVVAAFSSGGNLAYEPVTIWGNGFTSNGRGYFGVLDQLASQEGGGTPLFKAAASMVQYTRSRAPNANRAVVVFTDGQDTDGGWSLEEVVDYANQQDVRLYTVGLSGDVDSVVLSRLAHETGGTAMWAADARQLVSLYKTLGGVLRGSVSFYRTRWTARLVNGQKWGRGGWIQNGVRVATPQGEVWTPFFVQIP